MLRPCASLWYAMVLLAKLTASFSTDRWSAVCRQGFAWEQSGLQKKFLAVGCAASVRMLTGWLLFMKLSDIKLLMFRKSPGEVHYRLVFFARK